MLAGFQGSHDGVTRRAEVHPRVPVLRLIAAAHMSAVPAESQMHPCVPELEALLAAASTRLGSPYEI